LSSRERGRSDLRVSNAEGNVCIEALVEVNVEFVEAGGNRTSWVVGAADEMRLSVEYKK
jgi:hypothetical protein